MFNNISLHNFITFMLDRSVKMNFKLIISSCFILSFLACSQDDVVLENQAKKGKSQLNPPVEKKESKETVAVEVIPNANSDIKRARELVKSDANNYNNHVELVINKYKIENLKDRELQEYIKSIFVLYENSENMNFYEVPMSFQEKDFARFETEDFVKVQYHIEIEKRTFNNVNHTYTKHKDWYVYQIDGKPFLGTDGLIPTEEIKHIKVKYNGNIVSIPKDAYSDLYEPNICSRNLEELDTYCYIHPYLTKDGEHLFLLMEGSNGAGVYEVIWVFRNGEFITRAINIPY